MTETLDRFTRDSNRHRTQQMIACARAAADDLSSEICREHLAAFGDDLNELADLFIEIRQRAFVPSTCRSSPPAELPPQAGNLPTTAENVVVGIFSQDRNYWSDL